MINRVDMYCLRLEHEQMGDQSPKDVGINKIRVLNGVDCRRTCSSCLLKAKVAAVLNAKVRRLGIPLARSLTALGHMAIYGHACAGTLSGSAGGIYPRLDAEVRRWLDRGPVVTFTLGECANITPFGIWLALDKDWG